MGQNGVVRWVSVARGTRGFRMKLPPLARVSSVGRYSVTQSWERVRNFAPQGSSIYISLERDPTMYGLLTLQAPPFILLIFPVDTDVVRSE
jgi:hypothetical protein